MSAAGRHDQTITSRTSVKSHASSDEARQRRADSTLTIRKNSRLESTIKRRQACSASLSLSSSSSSVDRPIRTDLLPGAARALLHGDEQQALEGVRYIRELLALAHRPPIDAVLACDGLLERLVALLSSRRASAAVRLEACWALTNIASGNSAQTHRLVAAGAVAPLVDALVGSDDDELCQQAIWALANVAGDSAELRDAVIETGVVAHLIQVAEEARSPRVLKNTAWLISNLCRNEPCTSLSVVRALLPTLVLLLNFPDDDVVQDAVWAFAYLTERPLRERRKKTLSAVVKCGVAARFVQLMSHPYTQIQTAALRAVGNLVTGSRRHTDAALQAGCLPPLGRFLASTKRSLRKEAAWALSNITAGTVAQIQAVVDQPQLLDRLATTALTAEHAAREEAAYAICNAVVGGTDEQLARLADTPHLIDALCQMLSRSSLRITALCLTALIKIVATTHDAVSPAHARRHALTMQRAGVVDLLWGLLDLANEKINRKANELMTLLGLDDEPVDDIQPVVQQDAFAFQEPDGDIFFN